MTFENIYNDINDKFIDFENTPFLKILNINDFEKMTDDTLKINEININLFIQYLNNENICHIIKERMSKYRYSLEYEENISELLDLTISYFTKNSKKIFNASKEYQKYRFNQKVGKEKIIYCIDYKRMKPYLQRKDKFKKIFIPSNGWYYLLVVDYIVTYYCSKKFYYKKIVNEIPYKLVKYH